MEAPNWLPFIAICGVLFTISTLCLLFIRRIGLGIFLSFAPIVAVTIYISVDIYTKYEKILHDEGIAFLIYFFLFFYMATLGGVIWGSIVRYLMANARVLRRDRQTPVTRFATASVLVVAPTAIMLLTSWDRQRDAADLCFTHGIPVEIGGHIFAPKPIRQTSVNLVERGQTCDDRIVMNKRPLRRELCDLSKRGTRPIPTSILSFHWESAGNNALFLTFNPGCDRADLKNASADRVSSCAAQREAFMPYFKSMSLRVPAHEHWLLSEWGQNYRGDALDVVTADGARYRYRCTKPIDSPFYEGGRQCIAYRLIDEQLVVQISFKTKRDEVAETVLERFEQDLGLILSKLEWNQR